MKKKSWTGWVRASREASDIFEVVDDYDGTTIELAAAVFTTKCSGEGYTKKIRITVEELDTKPKSIREKR